MVVKTVLLMVIMTDTSCRDSVECCRHYHRHAYMLYCYRPYDGEKSKNIDNDDGSTRVEMVKINEANEWSMVL